MNKKIIAAVVALTLSSASLLACGMQAKSNHHDRFQKNVMHLDLTKEQKSAIKAIYEKAKKQEAHPLDALTETEFDKAKFIEISKAKREKKILKKAEIIAQVHAVLTAEQKKQLRVVLSLKSDMMHKKSCDAKGKSCGAKAKSCGEKGKSCGEKGKSCGEKGKSCGEKGKSCGEKGKSCDGKAKKSCN